MRGNIPLYVCAKGTYPVFQLEILCQAGAWYEPMPGIAHFTAEMLCEGTLKRDAAAVAQGIARYGAQLDTGAEQDLLWLRLTTLSKHLAPLLPMVREILLNPAFPGQALTVCRTMQAQHVRLEDAEVSRVAEKALKSAVFGDHHPYGRSLKQAHIEAVQAEDLRTYYKKQGCADCQVFMGGAVGDDVVQELETALGDLPCPKPIAIQYNSAQTPQKLRIARPDSLQEAIAIGKQVITWHHPDFFALRITVTLLGGYFGARLMRNLREEKGYTYGVWAGIQPLKHASYLYIRTNVQRKFADQACQEIYKEIRQLQSSYVEKNELESLKRYMTGRLLALVDSPFTLVNHLGKLYMHGLDQRYYGQYCNAIQSITPCQVKTMATVYLQLDTLSEVIVG